MFRRINTKLPNDPEYPHDLEKLGYFVNSKDEIKLIEDPDEDFQYYISKNARHNEKHREAMNVCIRKLVMDRLEALGVVPFRLPLDAKPTEPHIPILASKDLPQCKRIVLVFNDAGQDLGIWAYRSVGHGGRGGVNGGSAVNFVKDLAAAPYTPEENVLPGVVIANPGQLLWWRRGKKAVSFNTWNSLPRKSAVHGVMRIDKVKNRVKRNENLPRHVEYVFEVLLQKMAEDAKVDIVCLQDGGCEALICLDRNWSTWSSRVNAIVFGHPLHHPAELESPGLVEFLKKRGRAYVCNPSPLDTPLENSHFVSPTVSSGEALYTECIMPAAYPSMLKFFRDVAVQGDSFDNSRGQLF